ncbi:hypothetical protein L2735_03505 [Shewanella olleyana]|uniref:hypothetical protein n=1 Tax=Shewanella olleyana TaxID=135626 RepID=UPI00200EE7B7|nr:hypothetical protein [Shewanella olleyana]MCL1065872.1 hypothetical protein [Shewanella olleyana]
MAENTILGRGFFLLTDAYFKWLAALVIFSLGVATMLTLIIVPVFYIIFFKVKCRNYKEF